MTDVQLKLKKGDKHLIQDLVLMQQNLGCFLTRLSDFTLTRVFIRGPHPEANPKPTRKPKVTRVLLLTEAANCPLTKKTTCSEMTHF